MQSYIFQVFEVWLKHWISRGLHPQPQSDRRRRHWESGMTRNRVRDPNTRLMSTCNRFATPASPSRRKLLGDSCMGPGGKYNGGIVPSGLQSAPVLIDRRVDLGVGVRGDLRDDLWCVFGPIWGVCESFLGRSKLEVGPRVVFRRTWGV